MGLFSWYLLTLLRSKKQITEAFYDTDFKQSVMIVHGDTLSTVMGAKVGKALGMRAAHIEAGLRSFRWFSPFPEEFDRVIVSKTADYHFAPGDTPVYNLRKAGGTVINRASLKIRKAIYKQNNM